MAFFTQNKFNYTTGVPDGDGIYPSESSTWGDDGAGVLGNGTIAFPTAAGGAGQVLTDVAGNGTLTFASVPSTPPSGILGSVQLSDGAGGFTSDQPSFNYNSTTKRLGIGKVATTSLDVFHDDIDVNALLENVSASFDEIAVGLKLKHRSTNSMDPGLGIAQEYYIEDDTSGELLAGSITFQRQSADALRKFVVKGGTNGTQELFSIDSNREFTIEGGLRSGFGFGFTPPANSLAWNINNAGASVIIGNGGSGLGLRVLANLGNILSLEDTNQVAQVLVSNTGLVTFNDAANATADFEVKAQTTGTAIYADVSTGNTIFGQGVTGSRTVEMHGGNGASAELIIHGNSGGLGANQDTSIRFKSGSLTRWRMGVDEGTTDDPFVIDPSGSLSGTAFSISRASGNPAKFGGNLTVNGGRIDCLNTASSPASVTIDSLNRASSLSIVSRSSGGGSGRNAYMQFRIGTGDRFYIGMDDNDSGILKISGNGYFGSEDFMTFDQSTFKTVLNASASATGDFEVLAETTGTVVYADVSAKQMVIGSNTSFVNADLMLDNGGYLGLKETTTPTATASYAKVYTKNDNKLYFQDGAGTESALAPFVGVGGNGDVTFINNGKLGSSNALNFSSGKLTVNSTNASNGDFQVKGDLVDSLIHTDADNNRIGFGKFPTTFQYEFTSSTGITLFERETTSTNGNYQPFILRHRTTGNMTTGFGSGIIFAVEDATSGSTAIGQFQVNRGSSDANGEIKILAGVGGGETLVGISELGVMSVEKGVLSLKETTTPTAATDYGRIYTKSDNKLYFQDGAGTEHEIAFV